VKRKAAAEQGLTRASDTSIFVRFRQIISARNSAKDGRIGFGSGCWKHDRQRTCRAYNYRSWDR